MTKANLFVLLQLTLILWLFKECGILASFPLLILQAIAGFIGLWAIFQFRTKDLSISPKPKDDAIMVIGGPYKWIRNPMYLAVLLWCFPLLLESISVTSVFSFISLFTVLHLKLNYEEGLLRAKYPEFKNYCRHTKKLIPFIY